MDLVRMILIVLENAPQESLEQSELITALNEQFPGLQEKKEPSYLIEHIVLMAEAELVTAEFVNTFEGTGFGHLRMTWEGHDFIADAKNEDVWKKVKSLGDMSFTVLKQALVKIAADITTSLLK